MNKKKYVFFKVVFINLIFILSGCNTNNIKNEIEDYISSQDKYIKFNGSILIAKGEDILLNKGYGMANFEHEINNDSNTKFRIGSITKQFTATSILILQEQGLLNVTDKINLYIPNCPDSWNEITIHHLLTHSSGIPNFSSFPDFHSEITIKRHTLDQTMSLFMNRLLIFAPGYRHSYSNSGYIVLGYIIEKVSNSKYEDFIAENIFKTIGMKDTGYDNSELILKNRASGYTDHGKKNAKYIDMSIPHAAGALYSTVEDLYLWDRSLYTDKILNKESLSSMFTNYIGSYGYGWFIDEAEINSKRVEHGGLIDGFSSYICRYIDDDYVLIILTNDEQGLSILNGVSNIINKYLQD